jgi:cystathionine beta-synthase
MFRKPVQNVLEAIGDTPIVKLQRVTQGLKADIYVKLEFLNPGGSMKDRIALKIIEDAEKSGQLKPGGVIVEATSGNTGAGLAQAAAIKGYTCIFVMPDKMSEEKVKSLRAYGARVVVCPTAVAPEDPRSYYSVARRLLQETPGAFLANQYHNPSNPSAHYTSTGPEIWAQMGPSLDYFVAGLGTGGTVSGVGRYLKERKPDIKTVGVDPVGSIYYDYVKTGSLVGTKTYKVEGIGEDFLPSTMDFKYLDEIVRVTDKECFYMTRRLVREEGIYAGGSCGAAVMGAVKFARQIDRKCTMLVLLPDAANKYLSKIFDDAWMREHGFLEEEASRGVVDDLLRRKSRRGVVTAARTDKVRDVVRLFAAHGVSQVPVVTSEGRVSGIVAETDLLRHLVHTGDNEATIESLVEHNFATVEPSTPLELLTEFVSQGKVVVVLDGSEAVGIVTKIDLITFLSDPNAKAP